MASWASRAAAKSFLIGVAIALICAAPAGAHYSFGWGFSQPDGDPFVHAVEGDANDDFDVKYNFEQFGSIPSDRCNPQLSQQPWNTEVRPDEPVRVFRFNQTKTDGSGELDTTETRLQMNLGIAMRNGRWIGTTLDDMKPEHQLTGDEYRQCGPDNTPAGRDADDVTVYRSPRPINPTLGAPENFWQYEWLTSPYHVGGSSPAIYALIHVEFHGAEFTAAPCATPSDPFTCTMNSVTLAKSVANDQSAEIPNRLGSSYGDSGIGGDVTTQGPHGFRGSKDTIVATLPQQYAGSWGFHGYGAITNIVQHSNGLYYFLSSVNGPTSPSPAQPPGTCVLRTSDLSDPHSWRAWDGVGFNTRYLSPYPTPQGQEQVCSPVIGTPTLPGFAPRSLTFNENLKKYMAMGRTNDAVAGAGLYYSLSDDLINWTPRQLLLAHPETAGCPEENELNYADILDPDDAAMTADPSSPSKPNTNFDHPDRTAYLYATRAPCPNNTGGKDLVRTPIKFNIRSASLESLPGPTDAWDNSQTGYDTTGGTGPFTTTSTTSYDGTSSSVATTPVGQPRSYGRLNTRWNNGDDVWYGAAYKLPTTFPLENGTLRLMTWHTAAGPSGGIARASTDPMNQTQWRIIRDVGGYLPGSFAVPYGRWFWLEVHQRLRSTDGGDTLTEVFVDGQLVLSSQSRNKVGTDEITNVRYGFTFNDAPSPTSSLNLDRASISGGQLGALRGAGAVGPAGQGQAPNAPTGLRWVPLTPTLVGLVWNAPEQPSGWDAPAGYRLYRKDGSGAYDLGTTIMGTNGTINSVPSCPSPSGSRTFSYRVTALRQLPGGATVESTVSTPLDVTVPCS